MNGCLQGTPPVSIVTRRREIGTSRTLFFTRTHPTAYNSPDNPTPNLPLKANFSPLLYFSSCLSQHVDKRSHLLLSGSHHHSCPEYLDNIHGLWAYWDIAKQPKAIINYLILPNEIKIGRHMESRVADNCRAYSIFRNKLLEKAVYQLPIYAEYSSTFHSIVLTTSVICIVAIYAQLRSLTLFSLHPTCMIIGTFIFLAEGIVAYHNRSLLDTLSPIMQHNKKTKVRRLTVSTR